MAGIWRDQDNGYSSLEDENAEVGHSAEQTPAMVIDATLARLRARAGCQEDSFVRQLSTSLLSRMARNLFRNWESARSAVEDGERTEMPDFVDMVIEELRRFAQRSEISEEYDRRNSRGSVEHDELEEQRRRERGDYLRSPRRRLSHSRSMDDPTLDLDILQPVVYRSSPDSPMSPMKNLPEDPEEWRSFQRTAHVRVHRRRSSRHSLEGDADREERRRLRRIRRSVEELESSQSPKKTERQESEESVVSEVLDDTPKPEDQAVADDTPKPEDEAAVANEETPKPEDQSVADDEESKSEDLSSQSVEGSATPDESSTPSDELLTSVEENNPSGGAELETGTKSKSAPKDKERRRKRTRKVIEGFSNRQITSLRHLNITRTDALELIIQFSVSMDRLDRLINGPRSRDSPQPDVDESALARFFEGLEISRTQETVNRVPAASSNESPSSSIPKITEQPRRDPRVDDV